MELPHLTPHRSLRAVAASVPGARASAYHPPIKNFASSRMNY